MAELLPIWIVGVGPGHPSYITAQAAALVQANEPDYEGKERDFILRIAGFVQSQAQKLLAMAAPMRKIDPVLL